MREPFYVCRVFYISRKESVMGPIMGLSVIAHTLLWTTIVLGAIAIVLILSTAVPTLKWTRKDRKQRHLSIPAYYLATPAR